MTAMLWPDELVSERAPTIGPALQQLIDNEARWIHRRIERIELTSTTELVRRVEADLTVPAGLAEDLTLIDGQSDRFVIPFGVLPKAPLLDFVLEPYEVQRLTADQANPLVVATLAPLVAEVADPSDPLFASVLRHLRVIIRSETPGGPAGSEEYRRLANQLSGSHRNAFTERLLARARELDSRYVVIGVVTAQVGIPTRVSYSYRQKVRATAAGGVDDPPLEIDVDLPHASGPGPGYRVELVAPEGLDIEAASIVARSGSGIRVIVSATASG
jgi:hypothetical protein